MLVAMQKKRLRKWHVVLVVAAVLVIWGGFFAWYKFFREVDQPAWITSDPTTNFLYGSIGSENQAGMPYWIVVVLPRIFSDYFPGPGGYTSLGLPWEEGREFPAGFSKKTIGFERVAFNCALCHATQYRTDKEQTPTIVAGGGSHTADIQGLLEFFSKSAGDPRFNADTIMAEIDRTYKLSWIDRLIYKYLFIPITRKRLIEQGEDFAWADSRPRWGPGRDAPMNLTKFNFLQMERDNSVDNTDFPSIWHLDVRVQKGRTWPEDDYAMVADFSKLAIEPSRLMLMNLAGDTTSFRSVLIDSAMGLQAESTPFFHRRMQELEAWLRKLPPPQYPKAFGINKQLVAQGEPLFERHCADCHATGRDNRMGTVIPIEEIGTDPERTNAWTLEAANAANEKVAEMGVQRTPMSKPAQPGYIALQLDGIWLRGPYLHNGSVPNLRDLLKPAAKRASVFYRGYDVYDPKNVGFITQGLDAKQFGWRFDTSVRGNGNKGHEYGTDLSPQEKEALLEYLKTL